MQKWKIDEPCAAGRTGRGTKARMQADSTGARLRLSAAAPHSLGKFCVCRKDCGRLIQCETDDLCLRSRRTMRVEEVRA